MVVGRVQQGVELVVDLGLAATAHLVVALLQQKAGVGQVRQDPVAQVDVLIGGGDREVAALGADLVAAVGAAVGLEILSGVPPPGCRVHLVERAVDVGVEFHRIEDVELGLRAEVGGVRDAGADEVVLGLAGDVAWIARVQLEGERVVHEEVHVQRPGFAERIDGRGFRVGKQQHVGLVNRLEPANRGAVEGQAFLEHVRVEGVNRNCEVLHGAWQVAESDIDVLDVLILDEFEDVVGRVFGHGMLLCLVTRGLTANHATMVQSSWRRRQSARQATVFSTTRLFRPRDGRESNLLRTKIGGIGVFVVVDSACGTSVLTPRYPCCSGGTIRPGDP